MAYGQQLTSGQGRVSMQGSIIDTPCAIATADLDQTINMGITTVGEIIHNGRGSERKFSLNLVNCDLQADSLFQNDRSRFSTTFDGAAKDEVFSVSGASGVGIQVIDAAGNIAIPGQPMPGGLLISGTQRLDYTLRLVGTHQRLKAGEYHTILRFKLDYF
jgi:type 1 fimbria pilin